MDFIGILIYGIIIIVIIVAIRYIYQHYKTYKIAYYDFASVVEDKHKATSEKVISGTQIPSPLQGNEYSVSTWVYINDYTYKYGTPKQVLYRGIEKDGNIEANPQLFLHPTESTLMVRIKLQSGTVPDPNTHMIKLPINSLTNSSKTTVVNTSAEKSNISGNNVVVPGNNNVAAEDTVTTNIVNEGFYTELGSNILDGSISCDDMTHSYAIIDNFKRLDNHQKQMKELFEDNISNNAITSVNNPIGNNSIVASNAEMPTNSTSQVMINNINSLPDVPTNPLSSEFIQNNPFIADFMDKFSKASSQEERENIANDYASNFVDKSPDERNIIAQQFMKTLARMFASSMGLTVIDEEEKSQTEMNQAKILAELYDTCYIRNIPLQKWVNISVSVFQNTVDIYLDGKLSSSCTLKGFPQPNKHNVHITPKEGFDGYIANTKIFNMALTPEKAYTLYEEGPSYNPGFITSVREKLFGKN